MFTYYLFLALISSHVVVCANNIISFTFRDIIIIENCIAYTGQSLLVEVVRDGAVVGSVMGIVSGISGGFEVNHPGGYCWGHGTTLQVTPDIIPGDFITLKSDALMLDSSTIQNGVITSFSLNDATLVIVGFVASTVVPGNIDVRVVNPLLLATTVAKNKVIAIPGALTPGIGYSSGLEVLGTSFTATFAFDTQEAANIAGSGGGYSVYLWQVTAPDGTLQGLTIAEYDEVGGPFSTTCPAGPSSMGSPVVQTVAVSGQMIKWLAGQTIISAPLTTGFSVAVLRGNCGYCYRVANTDNQVVLGPGNMVLPSLC